MAYETPTVDDFRDRFPEFADGTEYTDEQIQFALDEAGRQVDETWTEGDYEAAILHLAAHTMLGGIVGVDAGADEGIKSLSIGPLSLAFEGRVSLTDYSTSSYGQVYSSLRRRNIIPVRVV